MHLDTWGNIVKKFNKPLSGMTRLVNDFASSNLPVIRIKYAFGSYVLKSGHFQLPTSNHNGAYEQENIDTKCKELLDYNYERMPLGIVLNGSLESFIASESDKHILTSGSLRCGQRFGGLSLFQNNTHMFPNHFRHLISGSRSLFALPRLNSRKGQNALATQFRIDISRMPSYQSHWETFRKIVESNLNVSNWYSEIALLPSTLVRQKEFRSELIFDMYPWLFQKSDQSFFELTWMQYLETQPLSIKTKFNEQFARYIISILLGDAIGFEPVSNEDIAPITFLTDAIVNTYKIRENIPTFMSISKFQGQTPVYASIQHNPFIRGSISGQPLVKDSLNVIANIKRLVVGFREYILENEQISGASKCTLVEQLQSSDLKFFHPKSDLKRGIVASEQLPSLDQRYLYGLCPERKFAKNAPFMNGCVGIYPTKQ